MGAPKGIKPSVMLRMARKLRIVHKETDLTSTWEPYKEQRLIWKHLAKPGPVFILKGRQIGSTTGCLAYDGIWTWARDCLGHQTRTALIWDRHDKAKAQLRALNLMLAQWGIEHEPGAQITRFPNGSEIEAFTAGSSALGRSLNAQRVHCSELPWWRGAEDTWAGMRAMLGGNASMVVETTMGPDDPLAGDLWINDNEFRKVFFPYEMHQRFRRSADRLSPEDEAWLRDEGFTNREAMASWLHQMRYEYNGDENRTWRELPQKPEHCFLAAEGRWVGRDPITIAPLYMSRVDGPNGRTWEYPVFRRAESGSGEFVIGVDTAEGKGKDACAAVVLDARDRAICASFKAEYAAPDDVALVVERMSRQYRVGRPGASRFGFAETEPTIIVEENGVGGETLRRCRALGLGPIAHWTKAETKMAGMLAARRAIESGDTFGPSELVKECQSCHVKNGDFHGMKDLLMALGFALLHIRDNPYLDDEPEPRADVFDFEARLREAQGRKGWGLT